jgi:hypothetical protein
MTFRIETASVPGSGHAQQWPKMLPNVKEVVLQVMNDVNKHIENTNALQFGQLPI